MKDLKCAFCGKEFYANYYNLTDYVYKIENNYYCSWHCFHNAQKNFKEEMIKLGAIYTNMESRKNIGGTYENSFWVKGFNFIENCKNVQKPTLIPITDENIPF